MKRAINIPLSVVDEDSFSQYGSSYYSESIMPSLTREIADFES